jgi:hypothetical protein
VKKVPKQTGTKKDREDRRAEGGLVGKKHRAGLLAALLGSTLRV